MAPSGSLKKKNEPQRIKTSRNAQIEIEGAKHRPKAPEARHKKRYGTTTEDLKDSPSQISALRPGSHSLRLSRQPQHDTLKSTTDADRKVQTETKIPKVSAKSPMVNRFATASTRGESSKAGGSNIRYFLVPQRHGDHVG